MTTLDAPTSDTDTEDPKTRRQPPYAVIVLNDNDHTYDYVISCFRKVFKYEVEKCFQLADQIHRQGRAVVWTGPLEVAELKRDQIKSAGPDFNTSPPVKYPLGVDLEPMD